MPREDDEIINESMRDKDAFKSERELGNLKTQILLLSKRQIDPNDRHFIVKERNIGSTVLIWGSVPFGDWGTQQWGSTLQQSFILGHSGAGLLGTSEMGSKQSSFATTRVVNPNRKFIQRFNGTFFKDTSTTATWTGGGLISFTSGQIAQSLPIYLNNETLSSATLTITDGGNIIPYLSADAGSNWEQVTSGTEHTFTNQGNDLRFKLSASATTSTSYLEVTY